MIPTTKALELFDIAKEDIEPAKTLLRNECLEIALHTIPFSYRTPAFLSESDSRVAPKAIGIDLSADTATKVCNTILEAVPTREAIMDILRPQLGNLVSLKDVLSRLVNTRYIYINELSAMLLSFLDDDVDYEEVINHNAEYFPEYDLAGLRERIRRMNEQFETDMLANEVDGGMEQDQLTKLEKQKRYIELTKKKIMMKLTEREREQLKNYDADTKDTMLGALVWEFINVLKRYAGINMDNDHDVLVNKGTLVFDEFLVVAKRSTNDDRAKRIIELMRRSQQAETRMAELIAGRATYPEYDKIVKDLSGEGIAIPSEFIGVTAELGMKFDEVLNSEGRLYDEIREADIKFKKLYVPNAIAGEHVGKFIDLFVEIMPQLGRASMLVEVLIAQTFAMLSGDHLLTQYYRRIINQFGVEPQLLSGAYRISQDILSYQPDLKVKSHFEQFLTERVRKTIRQTVPTYKSWRKALVTAGSILRLQIQRIPVKVSISPIVDTAGLDKLLYNHIRNRLVFNVTKQAPDRMMYTFPRLEEEVRAFIPLNATYRKIKSYGAVLLTVLIYYIHHMISGYLGTDNYSGANLRPLNVFESGIYEPLDETIIRIMCGIQDNIPSALAEACIIFGHPNLVPFAQGPLMILAKHALIHARSVDEADLIQFLRVGLMNKYWRVLESMSGRDIYNLISNAGRTDEFKPRLFSVDETQIQALLNTDLVTTQSFQ